MSKLFNLVLLSMLLGSGTVFSVEKVTTECGHSEEDYDKYVDHLRMGSLRQAKLAGFDEDLIDILTAVLYGEGYRALVVALMDDPEYQAALKEHGDDEEANARDPRIIAARRRFDEGISILFRIEKMNRALGKR